MAYRADEDLEFLGKCENEDLDVLVKYLTQDKDGDVRFTEELTLSADYKKYDGDHRRYWQAIAAELQCFGANSFTTIFRGGKGVPYREVLCDVCDRMKVNYNKKSGVAQIETNLLMTLVTKAVDEMTDTERKKVVDELKIKTKSFAAPAVAAALQGAVQVGGFVAYQVAVIVANAVARSLLGSGLSLAANATIAQSVAIFAGPIGIVCTSLWTLLGLSGPAYRVTMPSVVQVAFMRSKLGQSKESGTSRKPRASSAPRPKKKR